MRRGTWRIFAAFALGGLTTVGACGDSSETPGPSTADAAPPVGGEAGAADSPSTGDAAPTCSPDVSSDPRNCGVCGHDCLGGACTSGRCVPIVLTPDQLSPTAITTDDSFVYWQSSTSWLIVRTPKTGGAAQLVTATPPANVYYATYQGHHPGPGSLHVDATSLYFIDYDNTHTIVRRCPKAGLVDGGACDALATIVGKSPQVLAGDANDLFLANSPSNGFGVGYDLTRIEKSTGTGTILVTTPREVTSLAYDTTTLYWTESDTTGGAVMAVPRAGLGDAGALAPRFGDGAKPVGAAVDATTATLFWADGDLGTIARLGKTESTPTTVAVAQFGPQGVALDATNVYWVDPQRGKVLACPLSGCGAAPRVLATGQAQPNSLALDATAVYWTNLAGGAVMKVAK